MSVENLMANNLDPIRFEQKKAEFQPSRSIVSIIAQAYINQGKERIVELAKTVNKTEDTSLSQKDFFGKLGDVDRASAKLNLAAIFMGVYLQTFEDMLVNRAYDVKQMIGNFNNAIIGTPLEKAELKERPVAVRLSPETQKAMINKAAQDTSLAIFFEQPQVLPTEFQEHSNKEVFMVIRNLLLPPYKDQYKILREERQRLKAKS